MMLQVNDLKEESSINKIDENGILVGSWDDNFATNFFSNPENAGIKKLVIQNGHRFRTFSWLSLLTSLRDFQLSGSYDTVLDLSRLPNTKGRELSVSIEGNFQNITNWYSTSATSLSLLHIKRSAFNADDWAPAEKWGQNLNSFTAYYSLPLDFTNFEPQQLRSFHVESSALGLESLAECTLDSFAGDEATWNSLYMAFRNAPNKYPQIKDVHMVGGNFVGLSDVVKFVSPERIISANGNVQTLKQLLHEENNC